MKKYRPLEQHEAVQRGDKYSSLKNGTDLEGSCDGLHYEGRLQSEWGSTAWWRPIEDNWISFKDRQPTKSDGFNGHDGSTNGIRRGKILVLHEDLSVGAFDWDYCGYGGDRRTHWMPLNFVPRKPARIKVDGHEVIPQKNGDVKVGCQTVASKDFEEIVRQRAEAMK